MQGPRAGPGHCPHLCEPGAGADSSPSGDTCSRPARGPCPGGEGAEWNEFPLRLSAHPPQLQIPEGPVTEATSVLPGGSRVVRTPLTRGQGMTPGPVRGTFPEPSQRVALSPST